MNRTTLEVYYNCKEQKLLRYLFDAYYAVVLHDLVNYGTIQK